MSTDDHERWMGAWLALLRTHSRLWDRIQTDMRREHGLTIARYDVLAHLQAAGGRLRLNELASAVILSASGISKLLDRMEASGLIRREQDPGDARSTFAVITARGRSVVTSARRSHHDLLQRIFGDALDDEDVGHLTRIMGQVAAPLAAPPPDATPRTGPARRRDIRKRAPELGRP